MRRPRILAVDDQPDILRLVSTVLEVRGHACDTAASLTEARALMTRTRYDILFLDVHLPDGCGLLLLAGRGDGEPLVVVLTAGPELATAVEALRRGAVDFIAKPFHVGQMLERIDRIVEEWRARERLRTAERTLVGIAECRAAELAQSAREEYGLRAAAATALGAALGMKDLETEGHCRRVAENSVRLGRALGLCAGELEDLHWGAYLHDVGKIGVSEAVLSKPGALTPAELVAVRRHPEYGARLLGPLAILSRAAEVVRCHHERYDGSGYPSGLRGAAIPLAARLFAIVDTLDAMTCDRPYRRAQPYAAAAIEIERRAGEQFDPGVTVVFLGLGAGAWLLHRPGAACPWPAGRVCSSGHPRGGAP